MVGRVSGAVRVTVVLAAIRIIGAATPQAGTDSTGSLAAADSIAATARRLNPFLAMGVSTFVPGGGQAAVGKHVRGGLILATEVTMGLVARDRYVNSIEHREREEMFGDSIPSLRAWEQEYEDSMGVYARWFLLPADTTERRSEDSTAYAYYASLHRQARHDRVRVNMERRLARFDKHASRVEMGNAVCLMCGMHFFNIMDALRGSQAWQDRGPRTPGVAGGLSAVPALGLGQVYNGAYAKAGMVTMVQTALGFMAYNFHGLMRKSEKILKRMEDPDSPEYAVKDELGGNWESRRNEAFRKRNTYLWYSLFFYFYAMFDAVVDAHLHDASEQMRLEPDLVVEKDAVGIGVSINL